MLCWNLKMAKWRISLNRLKTKIGIESSERRKHILITTIKQSSWTPFCGVLIIADETVFARQHIERYILADFQHSSQHRGWFLACRIMFLEFSYQEYMPLFNEESNVGEMPLCGLSFRDLAITKCFKSKRAAPLPSTKL